MICNLYHPYVNAKDTISVLNAHYRNVDIPFYKHLLGPRGIKRLKHVFILPRSSSYNFSLHLDIVGFYPS